MNHDNLRVPYSNQFDGSREKGDFAFLEVILVRILKPETEIENWALGDDG